MTAVLFIHGFPFDHLLWRHQVTGLTRWQCLAPDLRGAGTSPAPAAADEYSMGTYADDLIALLRRFPERVHAAILCNTKAVADTLEVKRGRDALAARALKDGAGVVAAE